MALFIHQALIDDYNINKWTGILLYVLFKCTDLQYAVTVSNFDHNKAHMSTWGMLLSNSQSFETWKSKSSLELDTPVAMSFFPSVRKCETWMLLFLHHVYTGCLNVSVLKCTKDNVLWMSLRCDTILWDVFVWNKIKDHKYFTVALPETAVWKHMHRAMLHWHMCEIRQWKVQKQPWTVNIDHCLRKLWLGQ